MAARDRIHRAVRNALIRDGWTITHDPYRITFETDAIEIDLGAEQPLAAERGDDFIAVEIKSFLGESPLRDFQTALGQFEVYAAALTAQDPDRRLFLAITNLAYEEVFSRPLVRLVLQTHKVPLLLIDLLDEEVIQMDSVNRIRSAIRKVLSRFMDEDNPGSRGDDARTFCAFDEERDQYLVVRAGWSGQRRIKGIILHLRIADGQVWIEENGTDLKIADELIRLGVQPADIILGFLHPSLRETPTLAIA